MIKYLGSKRTLVPLLLSVLRAAPAVRSVADLFSGTSRVGHALKGAGYRVIANDHNAYAHVLAACYVAADQERVERDARRVLRELASLPGRPGYVTEVFCRQSRFFQPHNGERIDAIREAIAHGGYRPELEAVLLTSLMEAADRVDSTCGVQMAYVKRWSARSHRRLELRMPAVLPRAAAGPGEAHRREANELAREVRADAAYLDPPYNKHSYLGNYHVWESLVRWDKPEVYGVACKRVDCRTRKSAFNSKRRHADAFRRLVDDLDVALMVVSFNDEGFQTQEDLVRTLRRRGSVLVLRRAYRRYVGARIGIHNPQGERVGTVSHLDNEERVFVVLTDELTRQAEGDATRRAVLELGAEAV
ncbi:MAG: DNA adenine methylase [Sandaracinaceae bacterium]